MVVTKVVCSEDCFGEAVGLILWWLRVIDLLAEIFKLISKSGTLYRLAGLQPVFYRLFPVTMGHLTCTSVCALRSW